MELGLGKKARDLFIEASMAASASGTAQGAFIAERCLREQADPLKLSYALILSRPRLEDIRELAIRHHEAADKGPSGQELSTEMVGKIVASDFRIADRLIKVFPRGDLSLIYTEIYEWAKSQVDLSIGMTVEKAVRNRVIGICPEYQEAIQVKFRR